METITKPKSITFGLGPEFLQREGLTDTVAPWEDGLRAETGRGAFEWWYFDAALELRLDLPGMQAVEHGRALYEIMLLR